MTGNKSLYEEPIVTLRHNERALITSYLIIGIVLLYAIFGIISPVLSSGSYDAVWVPSNKGFLAKVIYFYMALFSTPFWLFALFIGFWRIGKYEFYDDRLEVMTYWSKRRVVVPFREMLVIQKGLRVIITKRELPGWSHPWEQFKTKFIDGLAFSILWSDFQIAGMKSGVIRGWENPEDGPKALEVLRQHAFSFTGGKESKI